MSVPTQTVERKEARYKTSAGPVDDGIEVGRRCVAAQHELALLTADDPAGLAREGLEELRLVGLLGRLAHQAVDPLGVAADQDAPALVAHAVEDDRRGFGRRRRRILKEAPRPLERSSCGASSSESLAVSMPIEAMRGAQASPISWGVISSVWLPLCSLRELATIDVPMWPGITTEHLMCGALMRRSVISASVKPFTANLAAA